MLLYLKPFFIAFLAVLFLTFVIERLSRKFHLFGPTAANDGRHLHARAVSRFGGVAVVLSFWLAIFVSGDFVMDRASWGLLVASLLILGYGVWDDVKELRPGQQFVFQGLAAALLVAAGVRMDYFTNPLGGVVRLDQWEWCLPVQAVRQLADAAGGDCWSVLGSLFILIWIVGMMNVMNWLDGVDGLASGIGVVGSATLFFLSLNPVVNQPPLAILAAALGGAAMGFLVYNFYPAKIFLGTSGSVFFGFMLGALAIFSGGKIATALLIMGLPILDALWVIWQRLRSGSSIFQPDKRHLHHKLLELGFSQAQIVILFAFISLIFGLVALVFQTQGKLIAIAILLVFMMLLADWIMRRLPRT